MSIALDLVDLAVREVERLDDEGVRLEALHLRIGPLAGVVEEALRFAFEVAAGGTPVEGARLVVEPVPLTARCPRCEREVELPGPFSLICPACGTPAPEIVRGRELDLESLEVTDDRDQDRPGTQGDTQEERSAGG